MSDNKTSFSGLNSAQVIEAREKFGANSETSYEENGMLEALKKLLKEPMILLLLAAALIYFISGKSGDAIFLLSAICIVSTLALYQDSRSRNALLKLKNFTQANCKVIRNGESIEIRSEELVVGDYLIVEEGALISADAKIIQSNDFSVNESLLTGESMAVFKDKDAENSLVYKGTSVESGLAIAIVTAIGTQTELGKIGKSLEGIEVEKTPLELQINNFVKKMVIAGAIVFFIVWGINFFRSHLVLDSLLKALTLAMSVLPEEIPMALTTYMAIGGWRLMKMGIVVKQMKTVETLGSATVICTDKTGTLTENKMKLAKVFCLDSAKVKNADDALSTDDIGLIETAMWASEPIPFDAMEVALHKAYSNLKSNDERPNYQLIHEYPLSGKPPMMTHIFENNSGKRIIAAKGAAETIVALCKLSEKELQTIKEANETIAKDGYRVLAVAESNFEGNMFPATQEEFEFKFKGLVSFYDPPKKNITEVIQHFYTAGIDVKIITGDSADTTLAIANQVGFKNLSNILSGENLMKLSEPELQQKVLTTSIFYRTFPEAKLKIINALKASGQIVAMTGDGINDGPALKAAHIGIAMGNRGTELAKQAASLLLVEDDLARMVDAIAMGRKIYTNLKKAFQYIISIHIPIILIVFIPLALGWIYPSIFSPVHIIFLELIMGPTCSIIFENEPIERNAMMQKPRKFSISFFNVRELIISILQGLAITAALLFSYRFAVAKGLDESLTRTMVFVVLVSANLFLTLANRSFYYSIFTTIRYKNSLVPLIAFISITLTALLIYVKPLATFFEFKPLDSYALLLSFVIGFVSVIWIELYKYFVRLRSVKK